MTGPGFQPQQSQLLGHSPLPHSSQSSAEKSPSKPRGAQSFHLGGQASCTGTRVKAQRQEDRVQSWLQEGMPLAEEAEGENPVQGLLSGQNMS